MEGKYLDTKSDLGMLPFGHLQKIHHSSSYKRFRLLKTFIQF